MDTLTSDRAQDNMEYAYMGMNVNEGDIDNEWNDLDGRGVTDPMLCNWDMEDMYRIWRYASNRYLLLNKRGYPFVWL